MSDNNLNKKKKNLLKNKLADIVDMKYGVIGEQQQKAKDEEMMKKSMFYRTRPRMKSELIKPVNNLHRKEIRKQEELLGITSLV